MALDHASPVVLHVKIVIKLTLVPDSQGDIIGQAIEPLLRQ